ncbi:MAG: hypothetical protein WBB01_15330 [Phormidesmis sp.]
MTISNYLPTVHTEDGLQCEDTAQERLSAAEATAAVLDPPNWERMSDGIYRFGYVVALRTAALRWKLRATEQSSYQAWRFETGLQTLFVRTSVVGCDEIHHLRGTISQEKGGQTVAIDLYGNGHFPQVGQHLDDLGEQWAAWRLTSLEVAEEPGF